MENNEDPLAQFGLDAIDLRWTLKDIAAKRSWMINEAQLSTLIQLGLVELREDGVFLHPATAVPVRDIPLRQMQKWIKDDEKDAQKFWKKEKSRR